MTRPGSGPGGPQGIAAGGLRPAAGGSVFLDALAAPAPVRAVELRPPRMGLHGAGSVDAWIDASHGIRRLLDDERFVLLTDDATGDREEESLRLLTSELGPGADLSRVVPFLTCKHTLEYCLLFARRAVSHGLGGVTVTGGDTGVGPPRCLPRSRDLRARIRRAAPGLGLGAWANPYRDPQEQVRFLLDPRLRADYFLTQVVSHHAVERVERFLEEADRQGLALPGMFGVFYYRSGRRETLERLARFFPVPVEGLVREFEEGVSAEEICARSIRALGLLGVQNVYVCNLGSRRPAQGLRAVEALL